MDDNKVIKKNDDTTTQAWYESAWYRNEVKLHNMIEISGMKWYICIRSPGMKPLTQIYALTMRTMP